MSWSVYELSDLTQTKTVSQPPVLVGAPILTQILL